MKYKPYIVIAVLVLVGIGFFGVAHQFSPPAGDAVISDDFTPSSSDVIASSDDIAVSSSDDYSVSDNNSASNNEKPVVKNINNDSDLAQSAVQDDLPSNVTANENEVSDQTSGSTISPSVTTPSCSFPASSPSLSRKIILNEIAWMGSASSSNDEWIEIKNISSSAIDLSGWSLANRSGKIAIYFSSNDTIANGGLLLLVRNNSSTGISYTGSLSNSGDVLAIFDPQCSVSDFLDASSGWPAGNNTTKQTLERDADEIGWHTSVPPGGTPGAENSFITPPISDATSSSNGNEISSNIVVPPSGNTIEQPSVATSSDSNSSDTSTSTTNETTPTSTSSPTINTSLNNVLISVIQIGGASSSNDLVKLYNPTAGAIDMSGWKLHKRSETGTEYSLKVFPAGSVIGPGQIFIWANATNGFSESVGGNVSSTETLSSDNSVALLDANGTVIDAVAWGTGTNQFGEGSPYPTDPANGQLLIRQSSNGVMVNTENNANDFILQ